MDVVFEKDLDFYRESNTKWFIDLPEWKGSKEDLEMVDGADTMLDIILTNYYQGNGNKVSLNVSIDEYDWMGTYVFMLEKVSECNTKGGAHYKLTSGDRDWETFKLTLLPLP